MYELFKLNSNIFSHSFVPRAILWVQQFTIYVKGHLLWNHFFSEENEFVTTKHIFQEDAFRLCGKKMYNQDASMWNLTGGWSNLLNNNLVLISWNLEEFKQRKGVECNICTQLLLNTLMLIFCHFIKLKVKRAIFFFSDRLNREIHTNHTLWFAVMLFCLNSWQ